MSRFHVHIAVDDLDRNIRFYSAVFGSEPGVRKTDYAKWALTEPAINFAISARGRRASLDHVGIQADDAGELAVIRERLEAAGIAGLAQEATTCCYAKSDKYWVQDPQGIAWETFHTLGDAPLFGAVAADVTAGACCAPALSSRCC
ncbi:MAG: glyoxalase/bleomycin resistance protein/dioxygenase [Gammaproteobacteria bacterium]|nr:MAG: glyoxalase/bleomycin resistance protein/dioxygenase [Gammaproteobacteria bacterium]TND05284.1 MAG: glyoxalase/bleomycin resistance protein/dioxygenase [Gammaproteobacteria bacterium]